MSPYKSFLSAARKYLESIPFLKFLLSSYIFVFSLGGLIFLLGCFIPVLHDFFTHIGGIIVFAGLLLTLVKEDMLTLVIAGGVLSFLSFVSWVVWLVSFPWRAAFSWPSFIYFLIFGAITVLVLVKSEKFKQMRAATAAKNAIGCPRCGAMMPKTAGFCPRCGAPNPTMPYQPYAPAYAPPTAPSAGYDAPQYAPTPPPFATADAAPVSPAQTQPEPATPAPSAPPAPDMLYCSRCGAGLSPNAIYCGRCGTKR